MINTKDIQGSYQDLINSIKEERDELRVKIHLAGMEVRDEWEEVERKWEHLQARAHDLNKAGGKSAHEVGEAFATLGNELKETYRRLRRAL